ncbi:ras-related protein Rab-18A-like isoform X2 [Zootermopsis nevadensis]|uniref:ras-related protein Rab-18A-like isoform X2 n=1 Tax=Zootermopsis nevadensis TaxID=136037 RepID=UPI000B8E81BA|nr:ras-related protein Rab-18A-like isoform X2 [Zootermopsis nevadensis]
MEGLYKADPGPGWKQQWMMVENLEVSRDDGMEFARDYRALFMESSVNSNHGVQCAFEELVRKVQRSQLLGTILNSSADTSA